MSEDTEIVSLLWHSPKPDTVNAIAQAINVQRTDEENRKLADENVRLRRTLSLLRENAELRTANLICQVIAWSDENLREYLIAKLGFDGQANIQSGVTTPFRTISQQANMEPLPVIDVPVDNTSKRPSISVAHNEPHPPNGYYGFRSLRTNENTDVAAVNQQYSDRLGISVPRDKRRGSSPIPRSRLITSSPESNPNRDLQPAENEWIYPEEVRAQPFATYRDQKEETGRYQTNRHVFNSNIFPSSDEMNTRNLTCLPSTGLPRDSESHSPQGRLSSKQFSPAVIVQTNGVESCPPMNSLPGAFLTNQSVHSRSPSPKNRPHSYQRSEQNEGGMGQRMTVSEQRGSLRGYNTKQNGMHVSRENYIQVPVKNEKIVNVNRREAPAPQMMPVPPSSPNSRTPSPRSRRASRTDDDPALGPHYQLLINNGESVSPTASLNSKRPSPGNDTAVIIPGDQGYSTITSTPQRDFFSRAENQSKDPRSPSYDNTPPFSWQSSNYKYSHSNKAIVPPDTHKSSDVSTGVVPHGQYMPAYRHSTNSRHNESHIVVVADNEVVSSDSNNPDNIFSKYRPKSTSPSTIRASSPDTYSSASAAQGRNIAYRLNHISEESNSSIQSRDIERDRVVHGRHKLVTENQEKYERKMSNRSESNEIDSQYQPMHSHYRSNEGYISQGGPLPDNDQLNCSIGQSKVGLPVATSTPMRPNSVPLPMMDAMTVRQNTSPGELPKWLEGIHFRQSKSVLHRPIDTILGYKPVLSDEKRAELSKLKPTRRLIGEVAFQLDRRILDYVFSRQYLLEQGKRRRRFYGFSLQNISHMIRKEATDAYDKLNAKQELEMRYRFEHIIRSLSPFGYIFEKHAEFSQDTVNKYGLMSTPPDRQTIHDFGLGDPVVLRALMGHLIESKEELYDILILLDCLYLLAHDDGRPVFLW